MIKNKAMERRLHPRIDHKLPLKVVANGYDFVTTTKNFSCIGTYCHVNKYVPPFTKVAIKITVPSKKKEITIDCKGVVVRTDDEKNGGFNLAIFFNEIKQNQIKKISNYIKELLA